MIKKLEMLIAVLGLLALSSISSYVSIIKN